MAELCTQCGKELTPGTAFCTECGAKASAPIPPPQPAPQPRPAPPAPPAAPTDKVVSTGSFFGLMLLYALPLVGWIICIVMAFAPKNRNIKNYTRAVLIWAIIGLVLAGLLAALAAIFAGSLEAMTGDLGEIGSILENIG